MQKSTRAAHGRLAAIVGLFALGFLTLPALPLSACTLWAAQGSLVDGGGTLVAKNRDWLPDEIQELRVINRRGTDASGRRLHPFLGLYAVGKDEPGCKAGVNDAGLVIVSASASTIPKKLRHEDDATKNLIPKLLERYSTVDEVLAASSLFAGPRFLLVADSRQAAVIEIGPGRSYDHRELRDGTIAHTNHYLWDGLQAANVRGADSSHVRLDRITALLSDPRRFTLSDFLAMAADRHDGPENSIFRTGAGPSSERTMASFVARIDEGGGVELDVTLYNEGKPPEHHHWNAAELAHDLHSAAPNGP